MRQARAAIPATPRKTLLEWIELDDGDTTSLTRPACSFQTQALHAWIALPPKDGESDGPERLQPPPSLGLPPLG